MPSPDAREPQAPPLVVCAGVAVLDLIFAADKPEPGSKVLASAFASVVGGCAANGAVTVSRLGARSRLVAPLGGPAGYDPIGDQILAWLEREHIDCSTAIRLDHVTTPISSILIDRTGERSIVTYRDPRFVAPPLNPDGLIEGATAVLIDDHYPSFALPMAEAAQRRGIPVVLDIEKNAARHAALRAAATHLVFSAEGARELAGSDDIDLALHRIAAQTASFVTITNGSDDILFVEDGEPHRLPAFPVKAVDTLAAGDVFHAAFALALAEKRGEREALRFAAAVAAIKCTRFGGIAGAPTRAEVEPFLNEHAAG